MAETVGVFGGLGFVFFIAFGVILAIAWIALPLALFGTKPLLREILAEMRRMNTLLEQKPPANR
jgi:hypothetical protein